MSTLLMRLFQGLDVPNIRIGVQYGVPGDLNTLMQRFGRTVRDVTLQGVAILIAEPQYFYEEQVRLQEARAKRGRKRKREDGNQSEPAAKRIQTQTSSMNNGLSSNLNGAPNAPSTARAVQVLSPSSRANRISTGIDRSAPPLAAPDFTPYLTASSIVDPRHSFDSPRHHASILTTLHPPPVSPILSREPQSSTAATQDDHAQAFHTDNPLDEAGSVVASDDESDTSGDEVEAEAEARPGQVEPVTFAVTEEEVTAMMEKRMTRTRPEKSTSRRPPRVPRRELCMFINAHNLQPPLRCRRFHADRYYANHTARTC